MQLDFVQLERAVGDAAWRGLHQAQRAPANPFCAPVWVAGWYRHFVPDPDHRRLCFVRSDAGQLIGVAPLWIQQERLGPLRVASRLRLVGAGQGSALLELPQVLTAQGQSRAVLGAIVRELAAPGSPLAKIDQADIVIADGQGWLEPEWLVSKEWETSSWQHVGAQASVILPIGPTWLETVAGLKRNVKESLRRSRNRLAKQPLPYEVVCRAADLDTVTLDRFFDLHASRAKRDGAAQHHDAFAEPERRRFLREVLPRLGVDGDAAIWELWLDGREVAAQLVLYAPGTLYVHSSGFDPSTWDLGPVTHLQEHAFRAACEAGVQWVNMSPGPNLAKMRWSEQLLRHDEFALGFGSRSTLYRQELLGVGRALKVIAHNAKLARRVK